MIWICLLSSVNFLNHFLKFCYRAYINPKELPCWLFLPLNVMQWLSNNFSDINIAPNGVFFLGYHLSGLTFISFTFNDWFPFDLGKSLKNRLILKILSQFKLRTYFNTWFARKVHLWWFLKYFDLFLLLTHVLLCDTSFIIFPMSFVFNFTD